MEEKICVAIVRKPQGIRGEVKVSVLMDNPNEIKKIDTLFDENGKEYKVKRVFQLGQDFGIGFVGFENPEDALKIKNHKLYADKEFVRSLSQENSFFIQDIVGKIAMFENGEIVGVVTDIQNFGASDVVFVKSDNYSNLCFANIGGIFKSVDQDKVVLDKDIFMQTKVCDEDSGDEN